MMPLIHASPDDHMCREPYRGDPAKLLPTTIAWLKAMEREVNAGHLRRDEPTEVWFNSKGDLI